MCAPLMNREDVSDADRAELAGLVGLTFRGVKFMRCQHFRRAARCWRCNEQINAGSSGWRPLGNGLDRMRRLHEDCGYAEVLDNAGRVPLTAFGQLVKAAGPNP